MSPSERERVRSQVRESRQRQGLPEHVEDPTVLARLAGRLLERTAAPSGSADDASSSASPNSKGPGLTNRDLRKTTPHITEEVIGA